MVILNECDQPRALEHSSRCLCLQLPSYPRVISLKTGKERNSQVVSLWVSSLLAGRGKRHAPVFARLPWATEGGPSSSCVCSVGLPSSPLTSAPPPFPNQGPEAGSRRITCPRSRLVNGRGTKWRQEVWVQGLGFRSLSARTTCYAYNEFVSKITL